MAWSSTDAGSAHIRIGTRAPSTAVYMFPPLELACGPRMTAAGESDKAISDRPLWRNRTGAAGPVPAPPCFPWQAPVTPVRERWSAVTESVHHQPLPGSDTETEREVRRGIRSMRLAIGSQA